MSLKRLYVIARTGRGRPTLQHKLPDGVASYTCCGLYIEEWSRAYMPKRIEEILCRKPGCRS